MIQWDSNKGPAGRHMQVREISHFDARGKHFLYGRGDKFGQKACFYLDIWIDKTGRLLARFWSHGIDYDWISFEVVGFPSSLIPEFSGRSSGDDSWIPESLRREYEEWVREEF
ncbi:MAG: hypothetical protein COX49_07610 [bacterium (Candidatus Stahlbacteria) CG23_combo_of_CG06-09_8_20_14_all_40_9]|nr:MAG: hypothetical protein COX49_07610 [bacterium (Candidatus Stahlbacteria) CG23_combo_of_CG06-09_8_20_14_all_40_9]